MKPERKILWWAIDGILAGMGMPFVSFQRRLEMGGALESFADDLPLLWAAGIRAVVSLLNIPADEAVFKTAGFEFLCLPIGDGRPPEVTQACEFVRFVDRCRSEHKPVAVHCAAGLGRTGTIIAAYLIARGRSATEAVELVRAKEPAAIESLSQLRFLEEFEILHRGGGDQAGEKQ